MFGDGPETRAADDWLAKKVRADGSVRVALHGPAFSLSAAMLLIADARLSRPAHAATIQWLITVPFDPTDGGVRDTVRAGSPKYSNVAAFSLISLLGNAS